MKEQREKYLALAFCWADLLLEVEGGVIAFAAGAAESLLGRPAGALAGTPLSALFDERDRGLLERLCGVVARHGRVKEATLRLNGPEGRRPRVEVAGHNLGGRGGDRLYLALRSGAPDLPDRSAHRDEASRLYDAQSFPEVAARRLKELGARNERADLALLAVPNDGVWERLDPASRESLRSAIGACLKAHAVDGDSAALIAEGRYGVLTRAGADLRQIETQLGDLIQSADPAGEPVSVEAATVDVGDQGRIDEQDLAKGLVYSLRSFAAAQGADFSLKTLAADMGALVDRTVGRIASFRRIVHQRAFAVAFHPIIELRNGEIHHFEALCRFDVPHGRESPFEVITFAEETGLIHWFDLAMASRGVESLARMPRNNRKYRLAVNVSGFSIGQPEYVEGLLRLLDENDWTQGRLMFEITESSRMSDLDGANAFIQRLRRRGYEVCLDDFGAGAASFQYLSTLDVDVVKLDGSAIRNAQKAGKGRAFLTALTELCRRLEVKTVAEMVDSADGLSFVRDCGCDFVQGFLFGRPSTRLGDFSPYPNVGLLRR